MPSGCSGTLGAQQSSACHHAGESDLIQISSPESPSAKGEKMSIWSMQLQSKLSNQPSAAQIDADQLEPQSLALKLMHAVMMAHVHASIALWEDVC